MVFRACYTGKNLYEHKSTCLQVKNMKKAKIWDARQLPAFLTPKEYAALMGMDPKTVQKMCRDGTLPAHKEGPRLWRIDKNKALEWLKEGCA